MEHRVSRKAPIWNYFLMRSPWSGNAASILAKIKTATGSFKTVTASKLRPAFKKFFDGIAQLRKTPDETAKVAQAAVPRAGVTGDLARGLLPVLNKTCFVAGTPILTPDGEKEIDELQVGDQVLSRSETDAHGNVRSRSVEKIFELSAPILELRLGGQTIETTAEHPFFVVEKGWVRASELEQGDLLVGHNDTLTAVETITTTDRHEAVYNISVADDHTYFVGRESWGFSVWVHNAYSIRRAVDGTWEVLDNVGDVVRSGLKSGDEAYAIARNANGLADALKRFPNAKAMDIRSGFRPPAGGREFADPDKLRTLGKFDWDKLTKPIIARPLPDGTFEIHQGMTRIEAALRAGITHLPVELIP